MNDWSAVSSWIDDHDRLRRYMQKRKDALESIYDLKDRPRSGSTQIGDITARLDLLCSESEKYFNSIKLNINDEKKSKKIMESFYSLIKDFREFRPTNLHL